MGGGGGTALARARMMFFSLFMKFGGRQNKEGEVGIVGKVENKFPNFNSVAPRFSETRVLTSVYRALSKEY